MTADDRSNMHADGTLRAVPVAWAALEDAFENNAPEVHSYLHLGTGDVIRVVDGVADPVTHSRIVSDGAYRRVDPVSSREQYRWMERFIATVEDIAVRQRLLQSIDGKGAFRRFKDALMTFPTERERWFVFRSERLKMCMEAWLEAQGLVTAARPEWPVPGEGRSADGADGADAVDTAPASDASAVFATSVGISAQVSPVTPALAPSPAVVSVRKPLPTQGPARMERSPEGARAHLQQLATALPQAELDTAIAFLEFLASRKGSLPSHASLSYAEDSGARTRASAPSEGAEGANHAPLRASTPSAPASLPPSNGTAGGAAQAGHAARDADAPAPRRVIAAREVVATREVDISARRPSSSADSDVSRRPVVLETDGVRKPAVEVDAKDVDPTRRSSGRA